MSASLLIIINIVEINMVSDCFILSQLCNGGSVTELIKGLLMRAKRLEEPVISYILCGALLVRFKRTQHTQ